MTTNTMRDLGFSSLVSPSHHHISRVIRVGSELEVSDLATRRIITLMLNLHSRWNWAMSEVVGSAMSESLWIPILATLDHAIPSPIGDS